MVRPLPSRSRQLTGELITLEMSGLRYRQFDPYTVTLKDARETSEVIMEAFIQDPIFEAMRGPHYQFEWPIPAQSRSRWHSLLRMHALRTWLELRNTDLGCFGLYNNGRMVAYARMRIPEPLRRPAPWWHRLGNTFLAWTRWIVNKVILKGHRSPCDVSPEIWDFFGALDRNAGTSEEALRNRAPECLSEKMLLESRYYNDDYLWCDLLGVRQGCQRKGYGQKLLSYAIAQMPKYRPHFGEGEGEVVGPAKCALYASKVGCPMYEKLGFFVCGHCAAVVHGVQLDELYMEKNLV